MKLVTTGQAARSLDHPGSTSSTSAQRAAGVLVGWNAPPSPSVDVLRLKEGEKAVGKLTRDQVRSVWLHQPVARRLVTDPERTLRRARVNLRRLTAAHPRGVAARDWASGATPRWSRRRAARGHDIAVGERMRTAAELTVRRGADPARAGAHSCEPPRPSSVTREQLAHVLRRGLADRRGTRRRSLGSQSVLGHSPTVKSHVRATLNEQDFPHLCDRQTSQPGVSSRERPVLPPHAVLDYPPPYARPPEVTLSEVASSESRVTYLRSACLRRHLRGSLFMRSRVDQGPPLGDMARRTSDVLVSCSVRLSAGCRTAPYCCSVRLIWRHRTTSGAQVAGRPKRVEIYARLDEAFVELPVNASVVSPIQLRPTTSGRPSGTRRRTTRPPRRQHPCPKAGRDATSRGRAVGNKELRDTWK